MAIVTSAHRPKRPPMKRKPQPAIAAPIVTVKGKPGRFGEAPDLTSEEQWRRGDAADALFRELVRRPRHEGTAGAALAIPRRMPP